MKNIYRNIIQGKAKQLFCLGLAVTLTVSSCSDFTELQPLSALSETTAFSTSANVELAMNGMYWAAAIGTYAGGGGRGYPFGAASIQQGDMRGEDMVNLQAFYQITYEGTYTATSANNVNHWSTLYFLINEANIVIDGVQQASGNGVITSEQALVYEAEAKFLRALAHHELLIHFCRPYADNNGGNMGVPYRTTPVTGGTAVEEGLAQGRGTVAEAYARVLEDLNFAEQNLPATGGESISRARKGAAIALKTRVYLHMQDYANVISEATKLGATGSAPFTSPIGGYALTATPDGPFTNYSSNTESVFSIANSAASNGGVNGALASQYGASDFGFRDLVAISPNFYNIGFWHEDDLRRNMTYRQSAGISALYTTKYYESDRSDWAPIIRYAEVILNASEAYARQGNNGQALVLLNSVRDRAVPAAASYGTTAPPDLLQVIFNERRIEFLAEGRRWPDIHRLALDPQYSTGGIPAKVLASQISANGGQAVYDGSTILTPAWVAIPYSDDRFVWPISSDEVNSNPTLREQQNPGY
ncbi:RagB/SusD family nutrient uptake outer membrane protein [Olivibacter sitiensis]|uniref:RagB/SusD family nutrient uptake outer membrane protein n=1 Tax=Olivibacter sitiensis TaxID=376470 RepID=UPI000411973A|nr:RagB/SusD family nutrient uptake outer membrane protein [Olivibacter sitiensis]